MCAADRAFLPFVPTALASVARSTSAALEIGVVLAAPAPRLAAVLGKTLPGAKITYHVLDPARLSSLSRKWMISPMAYARVLMPSLVPWDRFVYLDVDTLCRHDIHALYATELEGRPLGAVFHQEILNSGVLLFDAAQWRRRGLSERVLEYAGRCQPREADQGAIAAVLGAETLHLDRRWNTLVDAVWGREELRDPEYSERAFILHFITGFKPWNLGRLLLPAELARAWRDARVSAGLPRDPAYEARTLAYQVGVGVRLVAGLARRWRSGARETAGALRAG